MVYWFLLEMAPMANLRDLRVLSERLGYTFQEPSLLEEAFRHASYVNEQGDAGLRDNERLEFLGDAVLDLAIGHILMDLFKAAREGDLSKYRASVVNEKGLSHVARDLGLGDYLLLGKGEESGGGREKLSILADTLEALIGALYLDAGFAKTREVIRDLFLPFLVRLDSGQIVDDFKSRLQEFTQEIHKTRPEYQLVSESGPSHEKLFKVALHLHGRVMAHGEGRTKKEAEQKAAKEAFYCLTRDPENL
jgi:ribonuclease III